MATVGRGFDVANELEKAGRPKLAADDEVARRAVEAWPGVLAVLDALAALVGPHLETACLDRENMSVEDPATRGLTRLICALAATISLNGCSFLFTEGPREERVRDPRGAESCTTSFTAPVVDSRSDRADLRLNGLLGHPLRRAAERWHVSRVVAGHRVRDGRRASDLVGSHPRQRLSRVARAVDLAARLPPPASDDAVDAFGRETGRIAASLSIAFVLPRRVS